MPSNMMLTICLYISAFTITPPPRNRSFLHCRLPNIWLAQSSLFTSPLPRRGHNSLICPPSLSLSHSQHMGCERPPALPQRVDRIQAEDKQHLSTMLPSTDDCVIGVIDKLLHSWQGFSIWQETIRLMPAHRAYTLEDKYVVLDIRKVENIS